MALTINGKKNRLKKIDFDKLAEYLEISHITAERVYKKFRKNLIPIKKMITESFLSEEMKVQYQTLNEDRLNLLNA